MSVKQEVQALKDGLDALPPEDQAFLASLIPIIAEHGPRAAEIIPRIPGFGLMGLLSLAQHALTEKGRERLAGAFKEVFGVSL